MDIENYPEFGKKRRIFAYGNNCHTDQQSDKTVDGAEALEELQRRLKVKKRIWTDQWMTKTFLGDRELLGKSNRVESERRTNAYTRL